MNGYMNAEILGKNRGIKFAMPAIQQIVAAMPTDEEKEKMSAADVDFSKTTILYEMLYWGLRNNCYNKKEEPDFTFEDVIDWVDENLVLRPGFFTELAECFKTASLMKGSVKGVETEKKSNLTSKKKKAGMI